MAQFGFMVNNWGAVYDGDNYESNRKIIGYQYQVKHRDSTSSPRLIIARNEDEAVELYRTAMAKDGFRC